MTYSTVCNMLDKLMSIKYLGSYIVDEFIAQSAELHW